MQRLQIALVAKMTFPTFHTFLTNEIIAGIVKLRFFASAVPGVRPEVLSAGIHATILRNRKRLLLKFVVVWYGGAIVDALDVF